MRALAERAERGARDRHVPRARSSAGRTSSCPGTSYLERDGTYVNLEGRLQRLRRAVIPPAPDELAWIAKLAERFDVALSPYASAVFAELSERIYDGLPFGEVGEQARAPPPKPKRRAARAPPATSRRRPRARACALVRYRPLFSGPAVERVPELEFQRPEAEVELSPEDASQRNRHRRHRHRLAQRHVASSCARGSTRDAARRRRARRRASTRASSAAASR